MMPLTHLITAYKAFYQAHGLKESHVKNLEDLINKGIKARPKDLALMDQGPKDWYLSQDMVGMMLYVDLFAQDLSGMIKKIPYLQDLGITYVHLMPLLKPRQGESDGGYAVEDYLDIDPKLGTKQDFVALVTALRQAGIAVCIDFVLNHTADTHAWANKAKQGDVTYQAYYDMYDDRLVPDQYDATVAEVLPDKHPGNFTWHLGIKKWVFTSFSDFQWDLNYKNPQVFNEIVNIMIQLANLGVNILRLDAIAFMYKKVGTSCRNLKEVHDLLHLMHLVKEAVCPSLVLLGEAIVEPDEIFKYFGDKKIECGLLYNANMMVNIFNAFATRDTRLLQKDNMKYHPPYHGGFMNYVRCHDDIGWGLNEPLLEKMGMQPLMHKHFLNDFYSGKHPGSFARGEIYQYNPSTQDARINGTLASLLGLEKALENKDQPGIAESINRLVLAHTFIMGHRGIPLIYGGDEVALLNDQSYQDDPHKRGDGRWVHRIKRDWTTDLSPVQQGVYDKIKHMIAVRKQEALFNGHINAKIIQTDTDQVYVALKAKTDSLVMMYNFSESNQYLDPLYFANQDIKGIYVDLLTGKLVDMSQEIRLYPYESLWLKKHLPL